LGVEANMFGAYEFRLLPDFSNAQAPNVAAQTRVLDAYINIHYWDCFQIEAGKLKQPVSYEELIQDRFVPTVERSLIDQLVPARDVGFMLHGQKLLGNTLDYAIGVFNGGVNGDQDTNGHKDLAWRVAARPFNQEGLPGALHLVQIGISGTTGVEQEPISPLILPMP